MRLTYYAGLITAVFALLMACGENESSADEIAASTRVKFTSLQPSQTGIGFRNDILDRGGMNIFVWNFLYTGSGVAAGDLNGDGLDDLYFGSNQGSDRLYLNKGDFRFEDVTTQSGIIDDQWTTGITMADVNGDGHLDIYVCKNSPQAIPARNTNRLWINDGNAQFTEQAAAYGLADPGFSIQASFFDVDNDGDLDMYLINQPFDEFARLISRPEQVAAYPTTDKLYINNNGVFADKTTELAIPNAKYGLGISLGDFDLDGWTDIYISNDYHQGDHLLMNRSGKLVDELHDRTGHTAFYAMGSDVGDINNDGWQDVVSIDMAFEDHYRSKTNMGSMQPEFFAEIISDGEHYQYAQNALQLNTGHGHFIEIAQVAGVSKTDWSWSPIYADFDTDGLQDLVVTNGIVKDIRNNDYQAYVQQRYGGQVGPSNYLEILDRIPSTPVPNKLYLNNGKMSFSDVTSQSGFDFSGFSQGMAVADLDGDGDQDIVLNNSNAEASIFRNESTRKGKSVTLMLKGPGTNSHGLGISAIAYIGQGAQSATMQTSRGYMSSGPAKITFTASRENSIDSIRVIWNEREETVIKGPFDNSLVVTYEQNTTRQRHPLNLNSKFSATITELPYQHIETPYDDYALQVLLPYKLSQNGPFAEVTDFNNDGLNDIFVGGAAGQKSAILTQTSQGGFQAQALNGSDRGEDMQAVVFDLNGDSNKDLLISCGSNEFSEGNPVLQDRVLIGDGTGSFTENSDIINAPIINGQAVCAFDLEGDGDTDIFVGGRMISGKYPLPASSHILINNSGTLSARQFQSISSLGMVTDALTVDQDYDNDEDIIVVGEWMSPIVLENTNGTLSVKTLIDSLTGLWWTIEPGDFNGDGETDYLLGNLGWNNKFGGRKANLAVIAGDIDGNGDHDVVLSKEKNGSSIPVRGRECSSEEMPFILDRFPTYDAFAQAELSEILPVSSLATSYELKIHTFSSVLLMSRGNGAFEVVELPVECQTGPIKAFAVADFNNDGNQDFLYAGNHYPVEVETARYDGLRTGVAFGDGTGAFTCKAIYDGDTPALGDFRDAQIIRTPTGEAVILTRNDDTPLLIQFN